MLDEIIAWCEDREEAQFSSGGKRRGILSIKNKIAGGVEMADEAKCDFCGEASSVG